MDLAVQAVDLTAAGAVAVQAVDLDLADWVAAAVAVQAG